MVAKSSNPVAGSMFGRLTVIGEPVRKGSSLHIPCTCSCGASKLVMKQNLLKGASTSCGCLAKELTAARSRKYPEGSRATYLIWSAMHRRCENKKDKSYKNYGGRGITVDPAWKEFPQFLLDMGRAPKGLTLERRNNELGYSKSNCEWTTRSRNLLNKRDTIKVQWQGTEWNLVDLSKAYGLTWMILYQRLYLYHWDLERAVTTPRKFKAKNGEAVWDKR